MKKYFKNEKDPCVYVWWGTSWGWSILIMLVGEELGGPIFYGSYDIALWRGIEKKSWKKMYLEFMEWKMGMCVLKKVNTLYVFFCVYSLL